MIDHTNCDHPRDRAGRSACRKARAAGGDAPASTRKAPAPAKGGPTSLADACTPLAIDAATLDDRIRDAKRRPKASPVKVTRI